MQPSQNDLLEGEEADILKEVGTTVRDPNTWLDQPNGQLGGIRPRDLIGTPQEKHLRNLLRAIKHGMPT